MHIQISLGTKFHFKLSVLNFSIKLTQKLYFWAKKKKNENYDQILHIQINLDPKLSFNKQFWFLEQISKYTSGRKQKKKELRYWILHIRISLSNNFQLKLTIAIFWTKFAQKGFFWSKAKKVNIAYFLHNSAYSN